MNHESPLEAQIIQLKDKVRHFDYKMNVLFRQMYEFKNQLIDHKNILLRSKGNYLEIYAALTKKLLKPKRKGNKK